MTTVRDDALLLLHFLIEQRATIGSDWTVRKIKVALPELPQKELGEVDGFLLSAHFVDGTSGDNGSRWVTPKGEAYWNQEQKEMLPLSVNAKRLLRCAAKLMQKGDGDVSWETASSLGMIRDDYVGAARELDDEGLIEADHGLAEPYLSFRLSAEGRKSIRRGLKRREVAVTSNLNVGAIFRGPVTNSNVQAVGQAHRTKIEQSIQQNDLAALRAETDMLLDELVNTVQSELPVAALAEYRSKATEFKQEIARDTPNPSKLARLASALSLTADLNETVDLGAKTLELAVRVAPLILPLLQAAHALTQR